MNERTIVIGRESERTIVIGREIERTIVIGRPCGEQPQFHASDCREVVGATIAVLDGGAAAARLPATLRGRHTQRPRPGDATQRPRWGAG